MQVEYIDHLGSDLTVANVARVSFNKWKEEFTESDERLIKYLAEHNHWSPFGHPQITLRIKAPIFVARQLQKHVVGLVWNEVSRRYVDYEPEFYVPDEWRARPTNGAKQGSSNETIESMLFRGIEESWDGDPGMFFCSALDGCMKVYDSMIKAGICPEQARMVLPQSMQTEWVWTGSLQAFARVCNLRLDPHAQKEAQEIAKMISDIIEPLFPVSWRNLVE